MYVCTEQGAITYSGIYASVSIAKEATSLRENKRGAQDGCKGRRKEKGGNDLLHYNFKN